MLNAFALHNKIALITGGGTGLGKAIALCMIQAGARVVITGRQEAILKQACDELGGTARFIVHDVTQTDQARDLVEQTQALMGPPDILVHNAGIHAKTVFEDTSEHTLLTMLQTHVVGAHVLTQAFLPGMESRGSGHILFITSMAACFGIPSASAYTIAKSGQAGLVRALAVELSPRGIRVNAIAPGWIDTAMSQKAMQGDETRRDRILSRTPMNQFGTPQDIGWAAVYLSSEAAGFITGHQLVVDGGISIGF